MEEGFVQGGVPPSQAEARRNVRARARLCVRLRKLECPSSKLVPLSIATLLGQVLCEDSRQNRNSSAAVRWHDAKYRASASTGIAKIHRHECQQHHPE